MPARIKIIIGNKFGRLTILEEVSPELQYNKDKPTWIRRVRCLCECGSLVETRYSGLTSGQSKSCGCLKLEKAKIQQKINCTTHGLYHHPLRVVMENMKSRCYKEGDENYVNYGGRGIHICDEWLNDFTMFYSWAMGNGWKPGLTIDRIGNDGNYEPGNCRFVTQADQNRNYRRNINVILNGVQMVLTDACIKLGISYKKIHKRISKGKSFEEAISY